MSGTARVGLAFALVLLGASSVAAQTRSLSLRASALVAEPVSGRLYAALPAEAGASGNSVVAIDPVSATAGAPVFVGSDPSVLAATDDGQYLYIGFAGASVVRRFDVAGNAAGPIYPLPRGGLQYDVEHAHALATVPGQPHTFIVGQAASHSRRLRLVVYDDGLARPASPLLLCDAFVVADATTVVAASASTLYRLRLDPSGLTIEAQLDSPLGMGQLLGVANGLVFTNRAVFDLGQMREVRVRTPRLPFGSAIRPIAATAQGRYYEVAGGTLVAESLDTFDVLGSTQLDTRLGEPRGLVGLNGGVAYLTTRPQVVLVGDFAAPVPPRSLAPTARIDLTGCLTCRAGDGFVATATLVNPSPVPVRVEVKARLRRRDDLDIDLSPFGGPHGVVDLLPGTRGLALLQGVIPPGFTVVGDWRVELTLVEPVSGRTYATASQTFTIQ